ncbi:hypothetical protein L7F22_037521 [Adiantum nelumboides]|nr:hypothetical protein [Adiantum nelumboides]
MNACIRESRPQARLTTNTCVAPPTSWQLKPFPCSKPSQHQLNSSATNTASDGQPSIAEEREDQHDNGGGLTSPSPPLSQLSVVPGYCGSSSTPRRCPAPLLPAPWRRARRMNPVDLKLVGMPQGRLTMGGEREREREREESLLPLISSQPPFPSPIFLKLSKCRPP